MLSTTTIYKPVGITIHVKHLHKLLVHKHYSTLKVYKIERDLMVATNILTDHSYIRNIINYIATDIHYKQCIQAHTY